jgi:hypothetical protein
VKSFLHETHLEIILDEWLQAVKIAFMGVEKGMPLK